MKKTIRYFDLGARILFLVLCFKLFLLKTSGEASPDAASGKAAAASREAAAFRVQPGADDGRIAYWTARLLQDYHYSHRLFDDQVSSEFLDRYLELLDPQHIHFLQSDVAQFERFRTNLANLTMTRKGVADLTPAFEIFSRFYDRLQERVTYADELLKHENFEFSTDERISLDRRDAPYPANLKEAQVLWRQRLRYEYLQEKLGQDSKKASAAATNDHTRAELTTAIDDRQQIVDTLTHRYHRIQRMFADWNNEDVMGIYLTALARVYDPHSDYFNRAQLESFKISMNLELFGIGAELRSDDEGYCRIERLLPFGPAAKSKKITAGDRIVAVAQSNQPPVDVVDMNLPKIVQQIRGPKGTEVRLTLMPEGTKSAERRIVRLIRDEIPLDDQAAKSRIIELPDPSGTPVRLGVIDLPSFYAPMAVDEQTRQASLANTNKDSSGLASVDVTRLLNKFKEANVNGVILDLRYNGGGSLEEAIRLTGLFIKDGPVVQAKELTGSVKVERDTDSTVVYDGPLIVLTSRFSASASEIVAAALQDYGRALIVGDSSTHGKGTVQTVSYLSSLLQLSDADQDRLGALKFTIRKFYRPTGNSTQLKGVMPDIVLPSKLNYAKDIGESALENPLVSDRVDPARFEKLDLVRPFLAELLRRSNDRVATNGDFVYVREDIEQFRKTQDDKTVSLNETQRLKEQAEAEARDKVRARELRARPESSEVIYDVTLKLAALPGLPPPRQKTNSLAAKHPVTAPAWPDAAPALPGGSLPANATNSVPPSSAAAGNAAAGSGTNGFSFALPIAAKVAVPDDADAADKPAMPDADLNEAKRILLDYIFLRSPNHAVTGGVAGKPAG